jgi:hypothetical protein
MGSDSAPLKNIVRDLWESLRRAGDHWAHDVGLDEDGEDQAVLTLILLHALPKGTQPVVTRYIKLFLQENGWAVASVKRYGWMWRLTLCRLPGEPLAKLLEETQDESLNVE